MNKILLLLLVGILVYTPIFSQFYYSDIVLNDLANSNYTSLKNAGVKKVLTTNSGDEEGVKIKQTFKDNWAISLTEAELSIGTTNTSTQFYTNNKITRKEEEIKNVNSTIYYHYNEKGKLKEIISTSTDTSVNKSFEEIHQFFYSVNGTLSSMLKVKNGNDTTRVLFITDENNNVVEEKWVRKNKTIETYYYYYNNNNLLTDIVKFNLKANRMLPEFLFEYNEQGKLIQFTQIPFGSSNYLVWKYTYNNKQLKEKEIGFNKQGEKIGEMNYSYEYN